MDITSRNWFRHTSLGSYSTLDSLTMAVAVAYKLLYLPLDKAVQASCLVVFIAVSPVFNASHVIGSQY